MKIKKIGVIGSGTMGTGIAQVAASSGFEVILNDVAQEFLDRALAMIDKSLSKLIEKGRIQEEKETILARIKPVISLGELKSGAG